MVGLVLDEHSDKCVSIRRIHPQVEPHCCPHALPVLVFTAGLVVGAAEPTTLVADDKTFEVFRAEEDEALSRNLIMMVQSDWYKFYASPAG